MIEVDQYSVFINLTKQCNINCKHCFFSEDHRKNDKRLLNTKDVKKFLSDDIFKNTKINLVWEGGEPTVLPRKILKEKIEELNELPNIGQNILITNLMNVQDDYIKIFKENFNSVIETTFAFDLKETWAGSSEDYVKTFQKNLIKVLSNDITCYVNIELNRPSTKIDPKEFIEYFMKVREESKREVVLEIDYSVKFLDFFKNPKINEYRYPMVELQSTHKEVRAFLINLYEVYRKIDTKKVRINLFEEMKSETPIRTFNVCKEQKFLTFNPDGSVTTNPLYADAEITYIGNMYSNTASEILEHPQRTLRHLYEKKRMIECAGCEYFNSCLGASSHVRVYDIDGEECRGLSLIHI